MSGAAFDFLPVRHSCSDCLRWPVALATPAAPGEPLTAHCPFAGRDTAGSYRCGDWTPRPRWPARPTGAVRPG